MPIRNNNYKTVYSTLKKNKKYGLTTKQIQQETGLESKTVSNATAYLFSTGKVEKERIYNTPETRDVQGLYYFVK